MCSGTVAITIVEALDQMCQDKEIFTVYDVTVKARSMTDDNILHQDVRDVVRDQFMNSHMSTYDKKVCVLSTGDSAMVYYPAGAKASDHILVSSDDGDDDAADDLIDDMIADNKKARLGPDEQYLTKKGGINISQKLITQIHATAGSYDIIIAGTLKSVIPNKDGRVRVYVKHLGITNKAKVTVDTANDTICIDVV